MRLPKRVSGPATPYAQAVSNLFEATTLHHYMVTPEHIRTLRNLEFLLSPEEASGSTVRPDGLVPVSALVRRVILRIQSWSTNPSCSSDIHGWPIQASLYSKTLLFGTSNVGTSYCIVLESPLRCRRTGGFAFARATSR